MSKNNVLIISIISLVLSAMYNFMIFTKPISQVLFILTAISWIAVIYAIFADAKQRNKSVAFAGLGLFLGGFGGLIYYIIIFKESDENLKLVAQKGVSKTSKKNLKIFSIFLTIIFGIAFIMTLPLSENSSLNLPLTTTLGIIFLLSIGMIFYSKNNN